MRPRVSVFIACSLDGFIARPDGGIDWLDAANARVPEGEDCGFGEFIDAIDVLVMGRRSFEKVLSFGVWPYEGTPVIVLSHSSLEIPEQLQGKVRQESGQPSDLCRRLAEEGVRHIYVDGGATIQGFLSDRQVDELTVTLIPVLLGEGISLFGDLPEDQVLECLNVTSYEFGFVQLHYRVITHPGNQPIGSDSLGSDALGSEDSGRDFFAAVQGGDLDQVAARVRDNPEDLNRRNREGATALHLAVLNGHREMARLLLESGAEVNSRDTSFGATPAGWAIEYLRESGGLLATEIEDLVHAIERGDEHWVARFLRRFPGLREATTESGVSMREIAEKSGSDQIRHLFIPPGPEDREPD